MRARYAMLDTIPGYGLLTDDRRVLFADHDGHMTPLTDADAPRFIVLGDVGTAEEQTLLDRLAGGASRIACTRHSER